MQETYEIIHYATCLNSGFKLDYKDFTLTEQDLISYAVIQIKRKGEENKQTQLLEFLNKAFNNLGKGLKAIARIIGKKGI